MNPHIVVLMQWSSRTPQHGKRLPWGNLKLLGKTTRSLVLLFNLQIFSELMVFPSLGVGTTETEVL